MASVLARCAWLSSVAVLVLAGCGSRSTYVETGARPPAPTRHASPSDVDVYTATRPTRPFREAGMIESRQQSGWSTDDANDVVQELRRAAAARGCDGIIVTGSADEVAVSSTTVATGPNTGPIVGMSATTLKGYRATCIVYTRERSVDPRHKAMAAARVTRRWSPKGRWELSLVVGGNDAKLTVSGAPSDVENVHLSLQLKYALKSSTSHSGPAHQSCNIELVANEATSVATERQFTKNLVYETIEGQLETKALEQALETDAALLKVCDTEIKLGAKTRKRLTVFAHLLRTEAEEKAGTSPTQQIEL